MKEAVIHYAENLTPLPRKSVIELVENLIEPSKVQSSEFHDKKFALKGVVGRSL